MGKPQVDYSIYLVTDSTEAILGRRDLVQVVEQALRGGVTVVQYRDKTSDTGHLIATAKALHEKCKAHGIPLLINDRVDVALAAGCEGVHLGQDDMSVSRARELLGPDAIIGATVSSLEEARVAVARGADYLGIGTLYATNTKKNTKEIIGIRGIREILYSLEAHDEKAGKEMKTVCIGGINASNLQLIKYQLHAPTKPNANPKTIDGVAIVSAIMAASDPEAAAANLKSLWTSPAPWTTPSDLPPLSFQNPSDELHQLTSHAPACLQAVANKSPLSHNMTNLVVQNFAASVALAIGASPIMSNTGAEAPDLAKLSGGLVINMGTATPEALQNHRMAIQAYNAAGGPVVLDPVGAGATTARKEGLSFLLASGYFTLIKGNEREILAVARASGFGVHEDQESQQRGVDSGSSLFTLQQRANIVSRLALRERNIVLMTGATDLVSDGYRTYAIANGHAYLGMITGSGCTLGTTLSAYLAANKGDDALLIAVAGILHYEIAAERAAKRGDVKGPGTFVPAFVDELWRVRREVVEGKSAWMEAAKVEVVKVGEESVLSL